MTLNFITRKDFDPNKYNKGDQFLMISHQGKYMLGKIIIYENKKCVSNDYYAEYYAYLENTKGETK